MNSMIQLFYEKRPCGTHNTKFMDIDHALYEYNSTFVAKAKEISADLDLTQKQIDDKVKAEFNKLNGPEKEFVGYLGCFNGKVYNKTVMTFNDALKKCPDTEQKLVGEWFTPSDQTLTERQIKEKFIVTYETLSDCTRDAIEVWSASLAY